MTAATYFVGLLKALATAIQVAAFLVLLGSYLTDVENRGVSIDGQIKAAKAALVIMIPLLAVAIAGTWWSWP